QMMSAEYDTDAARVEMGLDRLGDLPRHPLLNLQASREALHQPRQLADPDHLPRQVADRGRAVERQQMVLAGRIERDAAEDDHLVARLLEGPSQDLRRVLAIPLGHLAPRLRYSAGCAAQPPAMR